MQWSIGYLKGSFAHGHGSKICNVAVWPLESCKNPWNLKKLHYFSVHAESCSEITTHMHNQQSHKKRLSAHISLFTQTYSTSFNVTVKKVMSDSEATTMPCSITRLNHINRHDQHYHCGTGKIRNHFIEWILHQCRSSKHKTPSQCNWHESIHSYKGEKLSCASFQREMNHSFWNMNIHQMCNVCYF